MMTPNRSTRRVRVLAADDSAVMRHMLSTLFDSMAEHAAPGALCFELVGTVADGIACVEAVRAQRPDIVLLDLEMPRMGGLEALDILHHERPDLPIMMCSTYTSRGAVATLDALARGATDYVTKPHGASNPMAAMASLSAQLLPKLGALAERATQALHRNAKTPPGPLALPWTHALPRRCQAEVVGIGVSTGGPSALEKLLPSIPADYNAPILIVQHMPKLFTAALAERLNAISRVVVREATHGALLQPGSVWIAPGDMHMEMSIEGSRARVVLHDRAPLEHCRPAVDYLFLSMARCMGNRALGVVLTGMGSDGLNGARALRQAGAEVLAQDEASSAIWGMPWRVVEAGLAAGVYGLDAMAAEIQARTVAPANAMAE
jgi:two-component system chemotaxis response regulator CheB